MPSATIGQSTSDRTSNRYKGRNRSYGDLGVEFEEIVTSCEKRLLAVVRSSLQDVVDNAQLAAGKGGRMRVDTGFLRASGQASLTGMPSGPPRPAKDAAPNSYADNSASQVETVTIGMGIDDTFFFGWSAEYARYRELYDGFLEGALQNWGRIVAFNTDTLRQKVGK